MVQHVAESTQRYNTLISLPFHTRCASKWQQTRATSVKISTKHNVKQVAGVRTRITQFCPSNFLNYPQSLRKVEPLLFQHKFPAGNDRTSQSFINPFANLGRSWNTGKVMDFQHFDGLIKGAKHLHEEAQRSLSESAIHSTNIYIILKGNFWDAACDESKCSGNTTPLTRRSAVSQILHNFWHRRRMCNCWHIPPLKKDVLRLQSSEMCHRVPGWRT